MFRNIFDLGYVRTTKEAVGFYFASVILLILTGVTIALMVTLPMGLSEEEAKRIGTQCGIAVSTIASFVLSLLILRAKKLTNNYTYVTLAILSSFAGFWLGAIGGLIIVSYLTTRQPATIHTETTPPPAAS